MVSTWLQNWWIGRYGNSFSSERAREDKDLVLHSKVSFVWHRLSLMYIELSEFFFCFFTKIKVQKYGT